MRISISIICLTLLPLCLLRAQMPCMKHYTIEDGLPSNTIYSIYPDSKGFLWFTTDKGIAKYNGIFFQTFTTSDGMPDNEVFSLQEDFGNRMWVATFNGKLCYLKDGVFHTAQNTPWLRDQPAVRTLIRNIITQTDSSVTILFGADNFFLDIEGEKIKKIDLAKVLEIFRSDDKYTLSYTINKIPGKGYEVFSKKRRIIIDSLGAINNIAFLNNNGIYHPVNTSSGMISSFNDTIFTGKRGRKYVISKSRDTEFFSFHQDDYATFFGRDDGLHINDSIHLFKGFRIASIAKDFQNNYWVSALGDGVYMLNRNFRQTAFYPKAYEGKASHALTLENTPYFITQHGNIYRKLPHELRFRLIFSNSVPLKYYSAQCIMPGFRAIIADADQVLLISNLNKHPLSRHAFAYLTPKYILPGGNKIYLVGIIHIIKFDADPLVNKNFTKRDTLRRNNEVDFNRVTSCAVDDDNELWYTVADSMFHADKSGVALFSVHEKKIFRQMKIRGNHIITITHDNQLMLFNKNSAAIKPHVFSNAAAIWSDMIFVDDKHVLISTNKNYYLLKIDQGNKLQPLENIFLPIQPEYMYADNKYCYFFKGGDITRIEKAYLYKEPAPRIIFSALATQSKKYLLGDQVTIPYSESKNIKISFSVISFCGKNLSYQYSLSDNNENAWQDIKGEELNLLMPSYGSYIIKVRVKTASSDYSAPAIMTLVIRKPYWATWWFWTIVIIAIASITWYIFRLRTNIAIHKKQQEFETERRYQQAEYKALNALMNPHFIFNSMNNIQGLINEDEKQTANDYLVIFSEMIRQNMHNIDQGTISLHKEILLCRNYLKLEKLRFKELINFRFEIEEDIDLEDIAVPPLLIQPLIENAIRHGLLPKQSPDSLVIIRITEENNLLIIEVEDNGIGLTKAAQNKSLLHQSTGISNMQKRIDHIRKLQQREITFMLEEVKDHIGKVRGTIASIKIIL